MMLCKGKPAMRLLKADLVFLRALETGSLHVHLLVVSIAVAERNQT